MNKLSGRFFDEADNFVFEAGKKGQFAAGSDYLSVVREIRTKQVLFEETSPDAAANNMKRGNSQIDYSIATSRQGSDSSLVRSPYLNSSRRFSPPHSQLSAFSLNESGFIRLLR